MRGMNSERAYGGESRVVRVGRRRQAFLDAALEMFGTVGYRKATVKTVCKQANLADRYFYESFDSLEDLLVAAYEEQVRHIRACMLDAFASMAPTAASMDVVEACLRAVFEVVRDSRIARLCWLEVLGISPRVDRLYSSTLQDFATLLLALARSKQLDWHVPKEVERMLGLALVGGVTESIQHWLIDDYADDVNTLVASHLIIFEGVLHILGQRQPPAKSTKTAQARTSKPRSGKSRTA
jgi:AcrR family transcriptional regulator